MAEVLPGNGLQTTLTGALTAASTVVPIQPADAAKWPASGEYRAVLSAAAAGPFELVRVTAGQGTANLTVTRAVEAYNGGQTALAWAAGATLSAVVTQAGLPAALGGITLPLSQNLTFSPDGTYDLGVSGSRPRDLNMSRTINAGGHGIFAGEVSASGTVYSATSLAIGDYNTTLSPSAGDIVVATSATARWKFSASGHLQAVADNTYDIGASGATRPRDLFLARDLAIGGSVALPDGTAAAPSLRFTADPNTGMYRSGNEKISFVANGQQVFMLDGLDTTQPRMVLGTDPANNFYVDPFGNFRWTSAQQLVLQMGNAERWAFRVNGNLEALYDNTLDIGASGNNRPRDLFLGRNLTVGGTATVGAVDTATVGPTTATQFSLRTNNTTRWFLDATLGNLLAAADTAYDIGASGANRPRDLFLGRNLAVAGTSVLTGNAGVGGATLASTGLNVVSPALTTNSQVGVSASPVFSSAATSLGSALDAKLTTAAAAFTMATGYGLRIPAPALGAGSAVTAIYGINIANQGGAGRTYAYGLFIAAQSGASSDNYALYAASQSWFEKGLGIGGDNFGNPLTSTYLLFNSSLPVSLTGTSQYGIRFGTIGWNAPTATAAAISTVGAIQMQGTVATLANHYHLQLGGTIPNGWTITNAYGINVANQGAAGVVNAYGLYIANQTGASTNNVGLRNLGTSLFDGVATFTVAPVLPNAAITNAKLAADTARDNLLVNGGFEIWQRGNGPFTVNGNYTADRWQPLIGGGSTFSIVADTANADTASRVCAAITYTHSTGPTLLFQPFASQNDGSFPQQLRGKQVTVSLRVKTSTAGAVSVGVFGSILGRVTGTAHNGNGTYQTLTYTATVPATEINFQVEVTFSASCTAYLDNAMMVIGPQAADYAPLHPADDLARCLRYYEVVTAPSNQYVGLAFAYTTTNAMGMWQMLPKSVAPTVTTSPAATWGVTSAGFGVIACTGMGPTVQAGRMVSFGITVAGGLVAGNAAMMLAYTGQTATLTIEANP